MNTTLMAILILMGLSSAQAAGMNDFARAVKIDDVTYKVSKVQFSDRYFAEDFCRKLNMKMASFSVIMKVAGQSQPPVTGLRFRADLGSSEYKGVWGWSNGKVVKADDTGVVVMIDGENDTVKTSLNEVNSWLRSHGVIPYKGLPSVCEPQ